MTKVYIQIFLLLISFTVFSQKNISANIIIETIDIDGKLTEKSWEKANSVHDFVKYFPIDSGKPSNKTEVKILFDQQNIYISAICNIKENQKTIVNNLKRDFEYQLNDAFTVCFDPFLDLTNGFVFSVNPYGVQHEGTLSNGGSWGSNFSWDNKWFCATTRDVDKWIVEMKIPFKSIRFKENVKQWKINFLRTDMGLNEISVWNPIPINFGVTSLVFCGNLTWNDPLPKTGSNFSLIPYFTTGLNDVYSTIPKQRNGFLAIGTDAKIGVTSSLNLDLTLNPDFSNVEVDDQVLNISRFSISYPEKRQFFIENSDLFSEFGFRKIRPFFSRQIGLKFNSETGIYEQVPIVGGARLSGKLSKNWRIGALIVTSLDTAFNIVSFQNTDSSKNKFSSSFNYENNFKLNYFNVLTTQRQIRTNSTLGFIFVNKESFQHSNNVIGSDFFYNSKNNKIKAKLFYHKSFTTGVKDNFIEQSSNASFLVYNTRNWFLMWNHEYIGKDYNPEVGFLPRKAVWRWEPEISYKWYPKSTIFQKISPAIYMDMYNDLNFKILDRFIKTYMTATFLNTMSLEVGFNNNFTYLLSDFDPSFRFENFLPAFSSYNYNSFYAGFSSDTRKNYQYEVFIEKGNYFNGKKTTLNSTLSYQFRPFVSVSFPIDYNFIELEKTNSSNSIVRYGPKITLTIHKNVFWTNYIQYNSLYNNLNFNSRLQWRFKPMSDLFVVYTDNYLAENENQNNNLYFSLQKRKNRALVLKLIIWLNI